METSDYYHRECPLNSRVNHSVVAEALDPERVRAVETNKSGDPEGIPPVKL